jgi:hypothetical protein
MSRVKPISEWSVDPHIDEWLISPQTPIPYFGGIEMSFICDNYVKDNLTESRAVESVVEGFLDLDESIREAESGRILENYSSVVDFWKDTPYPVKELDLSTPSEIWTYVDPREIHIQRNTPGDDALYILIECECEWEPEHGLQLVFKQGRQLTRVSECDGHLTEDDASG